MAASCTMIERRRASRVRAGMPLTIVRDEGDDGEPLQGTGFAIEVSRCGARLHAPFLTPVGSRIRVLNEHSGESREFRVIRVSERKRDGMFELGVEILYPTRNFWNIRFPDESIGYADSSVAQDFPAVHR
ncbi:MAG: hypothetical protein ACRD8A_09395 [Candidatus Acidiferrales bacterium]